MNIELRQNTNRFFTKVCVATALLAGIAVGSALTSISPELRIHVAQLGCALAGVVDSSDHAVLISRECHRAVDARTRTISQIRDLTDRLPDTPTEQSDEYLRRVFSVLSDSCLDWDRQSCTQLFATLDQFRGLDGWEALMLDLCEDGENDACLILCLRYAFGLAPAGSPDLRPANCRYYGQRTGSRADE